MTFNHWSVMLDMALAPLAIWALYDRWTDVGKVAPNPDSVAAGRIMLAVLEAEAKDPKTGAIRRFRVLRQGHRLYERWIGPDEQMNFEGKATAVGAKEAQTLEQLRRAHNLPNKPLGNRKPYDGEVAIDFVETDDPKLRKARQDVNCLVASQRRFAARDGDRKAVGPAHRQLAKTSTEMLSACENMRRSLYARHHM